MSEVWKLSVSRILMLGAGVLLLVGLQFLADGEYTFWLLAKVLYFLGIIFLLFSR